ncbi:hypothetical protein PINS_up020711 [Pythium insidiosum]|nr:hypothetical protein PINS_up020711 [Pythium insidiosum]
MSQSGFQTGSGKTVQISEEKMRQYARLLADEDDANGMTGDVGVAPSGHGSGDAALASASPFVRRPAAGGMRVSSGSSASSSMSQSGFQTGSGKTVQISEEKMRQYARLLADEDDANGMTGDVGVAPSGHGSGDAALASASPFVRRPAAGGMRVSSGSSASSSMSQSGFQTGSGKTVQISEEKIRQYARLLADEDDANGMTGDVGVAPSGHGSGDAALASASPFVRRPAAGGMRVSSGSSASSSMSQSGFQTGSGKTVQISEEKMRQYARLLADEDDANGMTGDVGVAPSGHGSGDAALASASPFVRRPAAGGMRVSSGSSASSSMSQSGFQTGSGKTVQISEEKIRQYARLLADEDDANGMTGDVGVAPSGHGSGDAALASASPFVRRPAAGGMRVSSGSSASSSMSQSGFQTGSGKTVQISEEKMRQYARLLADEDDANGMTGDVGVAPSGHGSGDAALASASPFVRRPAAGGMRVSSGSSASSSMSQSGFQTGSGKTVQISEEKIRQYARLLADEDDANGMTGDVGVAPSGHGSGDAALASASPFVRRPAAGGMRVSSGSSASSSMSQSGFQTGSGKTVQISEEKMRQYARLLADEDDANGMTGDVGVAPSGHGSGDAALASASPFVRRPAAGGMRVSSGSSASSSMSQSGFQTGSGKTVQISEEKMRQYARLLADEDDANGMTGDVGVAPSGHGSGDAALASASPFVRRPAAGGMRVSSGSSASSSMSQSGFQTGSGKTVQISEEKMRQYARLLADEDDANGMTGDVGVAPSGHGSGDAALASASPFVRRPAAGGMRVSSGSSASSSMSQSGFQTGSGKTVQISEEKMRQYARLLADEDDANGMTGDVGVAPSGHGSGDAALASASPFVRRPAAGGMRVSSGSSASSSMSQSGFQTGSGKTVQISEEKMRQYARLLADEDDANGMTGDVGVAPSGHGSGDAALASASPFVRRPAAGGMRVSSGSSASSSMSQSGFQTGSGKTVQISEEKIRQYARLLADEDDANGMTGEVSELEDRGAAIRSGPVVMSGASSVHSDKPAEAAVDAAKNACIVASKGVGQRNDSGIEARRNSLLTRNLDKPKSSAQWRPPRQLVDNQSANAYVTPAKQKSSAQPTQTLSGKKRFRPPVPLRTPPSKSLVTPPKPQAKNSDISDTAGEDFQHIEVMRIAFDHLIAASTLDKLTFGSSARMDTLRMITPATALNVQFPVVVTCRVECNVRLDESLSHNGWQTVGELFELMKKRGYLADDKAVTEVWFRNHYRWIVWKLSRMELLYPRFLMGKYLTKNQVMHQICHRHKRDIVLAKRSFLKKMLQRDASSASCVVLRIAAVLPFPDDPEHPSDVSLPPHWNLAVVLTDGWYAVYGVPDESLAQVMWKHHAANRLVGMKVVTWGATLQNTADGIDPLECAISSEPWVNPLTVKEDLTKWPYLQLKYNSTRPVGEDVSLGIERLVRKSHGKSAISAPIVDFSMLKSIPLRTLETGGGFARSVRVMIMRISPILHLQPKESTFGPRILCEEHLNLFYQLRQELSRSCRKGYDAKNGDTAERDSIARMSDSPMPVPFIKLDVLCTHDTTQVSKPRSRAVLTVWRPSEEVMLSLREGTEYFVTSLSVNWKVDGGIRGGVFLRLGTTKGSTFEAIQQDPEESKRRQAEVFSYGNCSPRICESIQSVEKRYTEHVDSRLSELKLTVDVCVIVLHVEDNSTTHPEHGRESITHDFVFVTDDSLRLMSLRVPTTWTWRDSPPHSRPPLAFRRGNKKLWSEGSILCLMGLEISHMDNQLTILDGDITESTQIVSVPSKKSHLHDRYIRLQDMVSGSGSDAEPFLRALEEMKKHIKRKVLHLEYTPTQDEDMSICSQEAEQLTQELRIARDDSIWMSQSPMVVVEASIQSLFCIEPTDHNLYCGAVAVAVVNRVSATGSTEEFDAVYLPPQVLDHLSNLVSRGRIPEAVSEETQDQVVHEIHRYLASHPQPLRLRFDALWETSERLLNSWKSWERDHPTFMLASSVSTCQEDS